MAQLLLCISNGRTADTPYPIDPFTFVSTSVEEKPASSKAHVIGGADFIIPDLPPHVAAALKANGHLAVPAPGASSSIIGPSVKRAAAPLPKTVFPDQHVPLLLTKIIELETGNMTFIVETIYKELSEFHVKKNAIEAKVREVGEKNKRIWVVKPEVKVRIFLLLIWRVLT